MSAFRLFSVPIFSVVAGVLSYYAVIFSGPFFTVISPGNVISTDPIRILLVYGILFFGALLVGGLLFFRHMTRREIAISTSLLVLYGVVLTVLQLALQPILGTSVGFSMYVLFRPFEWCHFFDQLLFSWLDVNIWIGVAVNLLSPYMLVLFGKKTADAAKS